MSYFQAVLLSLLTILQSASQISAQSGPPIIENFQIERITRNGVPSLEFTWSVSNVTRVSLEQDGHPVESRMQLPDGTFGWPPKMPGAFGTSSDKGTYTLIAKNKFGRVSAKGRHDAKGCFAWLSPPNRHWQRCRRNGQVAANLSVQGTPVRPQCTGTGFVSSDENFSALVPNDYRDASKGLVSLKLDHVWINRIGTQHYTPLRLSKHGSERKYTFNGIQGGHRYQVVLPNGWRGTPSRVEFYCNGSSGQRIIHPQKLHNTYYAEDS